MTNDTVLKVGIVAKTKGLKYLSVPVNFSMFSVGKLEGHVIQSSD